MAKTNKQNDQEEINKNLQGWYIWSQLFGRYSFVGGKMRQLASLDSLQYRLSFQYNSVLGFPYSL